jgi:Uma2 family endonuclease
MVGGTAVVARDSAPEPDVAVLRPCDDFYAKANPKPDDMLAVVEVSFSSLRFDRGRKYRLYARTGVPEYWIVDVVGKTVERCRHPAGEEYAERDVLRNGETIAFEAFPDIVFQVDDLIGPPEP